VTGVFVYEMGPNPIVPTTTTVVAATIPLDKSFDIQPMKDGTPTFQGSSNKKQSKIQQQQGGGLELTTSPRVADGKLT